MELHEQQLCFLSEVSLEDPVMTGEGQDAVAPSGEANAVEDGKEDEKKEGVEEADVKLSASQDEGGDEG